MPKLQNIYATGKVNLCPEESKYNPTFEFLVIAAKKGLLDVFNWMMGQVQDKGSCYFNEALWEAASKNQTEIMKILFADPRVDPTSDDSFVVLKCVLSFKKM